MKRILTAGGFLLLLLSTQAWAELRFPAPDFESGYELPVLTFQHVHTTFEQYIELVLLIVALVAAAWFLHNRRSRKGIFVLGLICLFYFGFWLMGCVCPIGAIQNVSRGLFDSSFPVSIPIVFFFLLPLLLALTHGRVFCGAVCPLGAVQDVFVHRPVRVPHWLEAPLGLLRYFYLGLAIFFVFQFDRFIICEFDPFVGFFRFSGLFWKLLIGAGLLALGLFIARPYCRYLCPYGALLSLFSRYSSKRVRVTPRECINCGLCDEACPFGAIHRPQEPSLATGSMRLALIATGLLAPVALAAGGYFALGNSIGGLLLGAWFGIVISASSLGQVYQPRREHFEVDSSACLSCGRCYKWCPHEQERLKSEGKPSGFEQTS